MSSKTRRYEDT